LQCTLLTPGPRRRPLPTRASHYVASIMTPLSSFLDDPAAAALQSEPRQQLAEGVVLATTARYQTMAAEMLDTVRGPTVPGMCFGQMSSWQQAVVGGTLLPHDDSAGAASQASEGLHLGVWQCRSRPYARFTTPAYPWEDR